MESDRRLHHIEIHRIVTVFSTEGLSKLKVDQLKYVYLNAFPGLTVLLSGKHSHLYLRYIRTSSHLHLQRGLIGRIDTLPFQVTSSERVFIPYNFGVKAWETKGDLRGNWFKDCREEHNCTTWLMCAPIGEQGERVFEMLGTSRKDLKYYQVHSNFKMTSEYMLNGANTDRVSEIIYWTAKPVNEAVAALQADPKLLYQGMFKWNERYAQDAIDANQ